MSGSPLDHILRCKPVVEFVEGGGNGAHQRLARSIGLVQFTMLGVGATIGTGIFVALTRGCAHLFRLFDPAITSARGIDEHREVVAHNNSGESHVSAAHANSAYGG